MRLRLLGLLLLPLLARAECPSGKNAWRDWGRTQAERLLADGFQPWNYDAVVEGLAACPPEPELGRCLSNLTRFSRARWRGFQPGHSLGLPFPDEDYFEKVPYRDFLELPPELAKPEFLAWLDDEGNPDSLDKALKYVASVSPRWLTFIYRSQHLPPDGTGALGRFFIYVPGRDFDRFFQFGLRHDPARKLPHGLSVVSVQKTDPKTGKPLERPRARAKDFWRLRSAEGDVTVSTRFKEKGKLENCYDCHKTALRAGSRSSSPT